MEYEKNIEEMQALSDWADFEKEMSAKYGGGKKFSLSKLSKKEFGLWCKLQEEWKEKCKASKKANKQLDDFYEKYKIGSD